MADFNRYASDGTVVNSPEYWKRRADWVEQHKYKTASDINRRLQEGYKDTLHSIEKDIRSFLSTHSTMKDINKPVTMKEYAQAMDKYWKDYNAYKGNTALTKQAKARVMSRINEMNARYTRTRLEVLKEEVKAQLDLQGIKSHEAMMSGLHDIYNQSYSMNTYNLARGLGYDWLHSKPNWDVVNAAILHPWAPDGSMFSDRIWKMVDSQTDAFVNEVRKTVAGNILTMGQNPQKVAKNLVGFGDPRLSKETIRRNSETLLMTESTRISEEAEADSSQELGLTHYVYLSVLDERTSPTCRNLDGQRFEYKERMAGTNFPPMHPRCRSSHYADIPDNKYTNRSYRGKDGKTAQDIPHHVTYKQWKKWQDTGKVGWNATPPPTQGTVGKNPTTPTGSAKAASGAGASGQKQQQHAQQTQQKTAPNSGSFTPSVDDTIQQSTSEKQISDYVSQELGKYGVQSVSFNGIDLDIVKDSAEQIVNLSKHFATEMQVIETNIRTTSLGVVSRVYNRNTGEVISVKLALSRALHPKADSAIKSYERQRLLRSAPPIDKNNINRYTATHEFAHSLADSTLRAAPNMKNTEAFWIELSDVQRDYMDEMIKLRHAGKDFSHIDLGSYADSNRDEFFAEAFSNGLLCSTPSPYGVKAVELAEKHFKR